MLGKQLGFVGVLCFSHGELGFDFVFLVLCLSYEHFLEGNKVSPNHNPKRGANNGQLAPTAATCSKC